MGKYKVESPEGKVIVIEAERAPTQQEAISIFSSDQYKNYLSAKEPSQGGLENTSHGLYQGVSLGYADEIGGALKGVVYGIGDIKALMEPTTNETKTYHPK